MGLYTNKSSNDAVNVFLPLTFFVKRKEKKRKVGYANFPMD